MKKFVIAFFIITCNFCISNESNKNDIEGIWKIPEETEGRSSIGEIFVENNKAYAYAYRYVFDDGYTLTDRNIENENSSAKELVDTIFLYDLEFDGEEWINGKIYRPSDGRTYNVTAYVEDNGLELVLRVSYDKFGLIGKTLKWYRIKDESYAPKINRKHEHDDNVPYNHVITRNK